MRTTLLKFILLFSLVLLNTSLSTGQIQYNNIRFKQLSIAEGLPHNTINAITQDGSSSNLVVVFSSFIWQIQLVPIFSYGSESRSKMIINIAHIFAIYPECASKCIPIQMGGVLKYNALGYHRQK